jgi:prepilin peptidase CpaA
VTAPDTVWFFAIALPFCLIAAGSDLRTMTIANWIPVGLFLGFLVVGVMLLPIESIGWRVLAAFAVLAIGFCLNITGFLGGGDAKFAAAMTPFVSLTNLPSFLLIYTIWSIGALVLHRLMKRIPAIVAITPDWESWKHDQHFPLGVALGGTLVTYLGLQAVGSI